MKTLKLLNKKNLSIIFLIFLGSISQAEDQPVDIWNIDKKKLDVNSLSKDTVDEVEKKINVDNEIKFIIDKKTNEQLNRFSIIYFNKVKKNILINEI